MFSRHQTELSCSLTDYLIRAESLLSRSPDLQHVYGKKLHDEFLDWVDRSGIIIQRELQECGVPFPKWEDMLTVGGETNLELFLTIGQDTFNWIKPYLNLIDHNSNVLDFGVGCGRTIRHFFRYSKNYNLYGCDVDRKAIQWLQKNVSFVDSAVSDPKPPLPYDSRTFDLIYAISVFSHLNEIYFKDWLSEVARCLKPGGILIFTYHGNNAFNLVEARSMAKNLNIENWDILEQSREFELSGFTWLRQSVGSKDIDMNSYGISFAKLAKILELSSGVFEVIDCVEAVGGWQDLIALRKI
jgi:SAM-dependent methyltransferase